MTDKLTAYIHPTCSTCKRALKYLDEEGLAYDKVNLVETPPSKAFFLALLAKGVKRTSLLNTSGQLYRELGLKDKLATMSDEDLADLLSKEGMLIKRPVLWYNDRVTFGASQKTLDEWRKDNEV